MMDGLNPYPEYKDPGIPWLGRIPVPRMTSGMFMPALHMDGYPGYIKGIL